VFNVFCRLPLPCITWTDLSPFCHNARVWQTDRRTDRRTEFSSQRGKNRIDGLLQCVQQCRHPWHTTTSMSANKITSKWRPNIVRRHCRQTISADNDGSCVTGFGKRETKALLPVCSHGRTYTVSQKTCHFVFDHNSGISWSIVNAFYRAACNADAA